MLLYFFTDLSSKAVMKQLSQLQVWKSFSVLILSVLVIYNAKYIFVEYVQNICYYMCIIIGIVKIPGSKAIKPCNTYTGCP